MFVLEVAQEDVLQRLPAKAAVGVLRHGLESLLDPVRPAEQGLELHAVGEGARAPEAGSLAGGYGTHQDYRTRGGVLCDAETPCRVESYDARPQARVRMRARVRVCLPERTMAYAPRAMLREASI